MAFDETLANRIRQALSSHGDFDERRMFGGLAFMVRGHMCCGIVGNDLMVRVGPEQYQEALAAPHARPMDFTGRPLQGMVYVAPPGLRTQPMLTRWVGRAMAFVESLPARPLRTHAPAGSPRTRAPKSPRARR